MSTVHGPWTAPQVIAYTAQVEAQGEYQRSPSQTGYLTDLEPGGEMEPCGDAGSPKAKTPPAASHRPGAGGLDLQPAPGAQT